MSLHAVDSYELAIGSKGNVIQAAIEACIVGLDRSNIGSAQLLNNHFIDVVDQVDVRRAFLVVGQHDCAVTTHEHTPNRTRKIEFSTFITSQIQAGRCSHITGQLWLRVVGKLIIRSDIAVNLQQGNNISCLVGLNYNIASRFCDQLPPLAFNALRRIITQCFIALSLNGDGVGARIQVFKHKHAVVVLVGGVTCHFLTTLVQDDRGAIDGCPLVHRRGIVIVQVMNQMLMQVLDGTHDVSLALGGESEVLTNTTSDADTLLMAIVHIQRTVTSGLIGVEIAFHQEAGGTMLENTQITGIGYAGIRIDTG